MNLGSVGSFTPAPMTGAYAATKAYVLSLSLALTEELTGTGVTVTALCPGPTATGFQARAEMADSKLIAGRSLDPAEDVVRIGYAAMKKGQAVRGHRNDEQGVRVRQPVPAADDVGEDRGTIAATDHRSALKNHGHCADTQPHEGAGKHRRSLYIEDHGGLLFVWVKTRKPMRGALNFLRTSTEPPPTRSSGSASRPRAS